MELPEAGNTLRIIAPSCNAKIISAISRGSSQGARRRPSGERAIKSATPSALVFETLRTTFATRGFRLASANKSTTKAEMICGELLAAM